MVKVCGQISNLPHHQWWQFAGRISNLPYHQWWQFAGRISKLPYHQWDSLRAGSQTSYIINETMCWGLFTGQQTNICKSEKEKWCQVIKIKMENSKQELLVQSFATSLGATVARDLGFFNGELVVIRKLLSWYNPAGERGETLTIGGSRRGQAHVHKIS